MFLIWINTRERRNGNDAVRKGKTLGGGHLLKEAALPPNLPPPRTFPDAARHLYIYTPIRQSDRRRRGKSRSGEAGYGGWTGMRGSASKRRLLPRRGQTQTDAAQEARPDLPRFRMTNGRQ